MKFKALHFSKVIAKISMKQIQLCKNTGILKATPDDVKAIFRWQICYGRRAAIQFFVYSSYSSDRTNVSHTVRIKFGNGQFKYSLKRICIPNFATVSHSWSTVHILSSSLDEGFS